MSTAEIFPGHRIVHRDTARRGRTIIAFFCLCALFLPTAAHAEGCPNETARSQQASSFLPDCRAYEMVSPLEKNGADIVDSLSATGILQASSDGTKVTYISQGSFSSPQGAPIGSQYLSTLTSPTTGWTTQNITTPTKAGTYPLGETIPYAAFSPDLATGLELNGVAGIEGRPEENPPLAGEPEGYQDYYLRDNLTTSLQSLLTSKPAQPAGQFHMTLETVSPDLKHLAIRTGAALTPGAIEGKGPLNNLYEWSDGQFQQINILPDGQASEPDIAMHLGSLFENGGGQEHMISNNGSRAIWGTGAELYLREGIGTPQAHTVQIDETQGGLGPSGGGKLMTASSDDTRIFFLDFRKLTSESSNEDLYEFNTEANEGHRLTDLTVDHADAAGAGVLGMLGESEDGSYIYFVAVGKLAGSAIAGQPNLYMLHYNNEANLWEEPRLIATLVQADANDWIDGVGQRTARVTPDGGHVAFMSAQPLTGYDNAGNEEVFLYDRSSGRLSCASCNPNGSPPIGPSRINPGTEWETGMAIYQTRVLSPDGSHLFFDTYDALVPQDTNAAQDVYEYENGRPYLISTGTGTSDATFVDASEDGDNVFFLTRQELVSGDTDQLVDLYDARVGGGTATVAPPACTGTGCQGVPAPPPVFATPSSVTFNGVGNIPAAVTPRAVKPKAKIRTRAQKLAQALKACHAKHGRRRNRCEVTVRRRYRTAVKRGGAGAGR